MRWLARLLLSITMAVGLIVSGLGLTYLGASTMRTATRHDGLPEVDLRPLARRSEIVAADGTLLSAMFEQDRVPVPLAQVPPVVVHAVVAVEDSSFYEHQGVSVRGLVRAARANAAGGAVEQGGSTITQQLVKNGVLDSSRSYDRKAKEAVLAFRLERELSKDQILETYLNTVYFGEGAYGIHAAARRYFGKDQTELTLGDAALLAGMISNPTVFDPTRDPAAATARRSHALSRMVKLGYATAEEAAAANAAPVPDHVQRDAAQPSDHFTEEVRRLLLADDRLGSSPAERSSLLLRGGIRVETTLDPALQAKAEQSVRDKVPPSEFTAALVSIDPADGAVRALIGGSRFDEAKFNLSTQGRRQMGSSFKTIALAAWIADGHSSEDLVDATAPCSFPMPAPEPTWTVDNYDGGSGEVLVTNLREATVKSSNCAYARVSLALGPQKLVDMAKRLGIKGNLPVYNSVVLGTGEATPLEVASVYATLAAEGVRHDPMFIRRVVAADGTVLLENHPTEERVLEPQLARTVTDVLRGVVDRGTGKRAGIGRPAAGKTGTAQEWRDAWFAGYTPQLATAVWMGSPKGQIPMVNVGGIHVTGGSYPAMVWSQFMGAALESVPVADFTPPDSLAWPPNNWIGTPPPVLPPGFVLPPHLLPPPPVVTEAAPAPAPAAPVVAPAPAAAPPPPSTTTTTTPPAKGTTTTTAAPQPTTTSTTSTTAPTTTTTGRKGKG